MLSADVPDDIWHPAAFVEHRLREQLPPEIPLHRLPPAAPAPDRIVHPLQNCESCDRAYRAPTRGHCPACHPDPETGA
ncbi:hypothetical protein [Streptomyces sp. NBC_00239]|uniref:hypothetical protein n=1 Tax=Streptomyces sp. NBC_00239 TaxID=2903640 RepID=UPI002E2E4834|nr:hypothetical protein [Streptomyces sp. NBC_00239]